MSQFPMSESRKRVLDKIPDYAVLITPSEARIRVIAADTLVAETSRALLVQETRHGDVYYLPRSDIDMSLLTPTGHTTYCPFKGHANYWSVGDLENVVWSYEEPYPEVEGLKDYLSFYVDRVSQTVS